MSELADSRCQDCSPKAFQCSHCAVKDITIKKNARLAKKAARQPSPVRLFPLDGVFAAVPASVASPAVPVASHASVVMSPVVPIASFMLAPLSPVVPYAPLCLGPLPPADPVVDYCTYEFPPMGSPAPLFFNGQCMHPPQTPAHKRAHDAFDLNSSSDEEHYQALAASSKSTVKSAVKKTPKKKDAASTGSESEHSSSSGDTDDEGESAAKKTPAKKMSRITKDERECVCVWIQKDRPDGKMCNGRWIRNGGAKGATMTATSGEVKTSGAHDSLAA